MTRLASGIAAIFVSLFFAIAPPAHAAEPATLLEALKSDPQFETLVKLIEAADIEWRFTETYQQTVFAPTDAAFDKLEGGWDDMLQPVNQENTQAILLYHLAPGRLTADKLAGQVSAVRTCQKRDARIDGAREAGAIYYGDGKVVGAAIEAGNGLVHPIDTVQLPVGTLNLDEPQVCPAPKVPAR